jgi:hypothetical protein
MECNDVYVSVDKSFLVNKPNFLHLFRVCYCKKSTTDFKLLSCIVLNCTALFIVLSDYRITTPRVSQHFSCVVLLPEQDLAPIFKTSVCYGSAAITHREYRPLFYPDMLWLCTFDSCVGVDVGGLYPAVHVMFQVQQYCCNNTTHIHMIPN